MTAMDGVDELLGGARARGAFALRAVMRAPWALRIEAEAPLTLIAMVAGEAWVLPDGAAPLRLGVGDVALTRGPAHYTVAGDPATPPAVFVGPGQNCRDASGASVREAMMHGVRTWGNAADGETVFLVGAYDAEGDVGPRLRRVLPPVLALARAEWQSPLVALLADEVVKDEPGQAAVLDRLIDLVTAAAVKAWLARPDADPPSWLATAGDPLVVRALRVLHRDPGAPWTVARLAREVGASRAALARRFHERVGEAPMTFLKRWRMALAADLLTEPGESVATVAEKVGYASPFAFSAAFKRVRGTSPRAHRDQARARAASPPAPLLAVERDAATPRAAGSAQD